MSAFVSVFSMSHFDEEYFLRRRGFADSNGMDRFAFAVAEQAPSNGLGAMKALLGPVARPRACAEPLESVVDDGQIGVEAAQLSDHRVAQWFRVRRQRSFIGPKSLALVKVADGVEKCGSEIIGVRDHVALIGVDYLASISHRIFKTPVEHFCNLLARLPPLIRPHMRPAAREELYDIIIVVIRHF